MAKIEICINETGKDLRECNEDIVKNLCELIEQRDELVVLIEKQYEEKKSIEADLEKLTYKLCLLNKSLYQKLKAKSHYDKTIEEIEKHYKNLLENSNKLRDMLHKHHDNLEEMINKKIGTEPTDNENQGEVKVLYAKNWTEVDKPGNRCTCEKPTKESLAQSKDQVQPQPKDNREEQSKDKVEEPPVKLDTHASIDSNPSDDVIQGKEVLMGTLESNVEEGLASGSTIGSTSSAAEIPPTSSMSPVVRDMKHSNTEPSSIPGETQQIGVMKKKSLITEARRKNSLVRPISGSSGTIKDVEEINRMRKTSFSMDKAATLPIDGPNSSSILYINAQTRKKSDPIIKDIDGKDPKAKNKPESTNRTSAVLREFHEKFQNDDKKH